MRCATSPTPPTRLITRPGHNPFEEENPMSRLKSLAVFAALAGTLVAGNAFALQDYCKTATANYTNTNATVQPAVNGTTCFTAQSNPVLLVDKTRTPGSGA